MKQSVMSILDRNFSDQVFNEKERIEIWLLLEGVYRVYGYDFRNYAYPSIRRRILHRVQAEKLPTVSALQAKVLHDRNCLDRLMSDLVIHVTDLFRDPSFFQAFRLLVVPLLRDYTNIRIWHAGCSTGEEAYSMAILLHEEGLYDKTTIYATDINEEVLHIAELGTYPLKNMKNYTRNYLLAGGNDSFSKYYSASYESASFHPFLKKNIVFAQHNLVTDRSFNEFHAILCRNVMIYFDLELQNRVHELFYDSLSDSGILALGSKESINFSSRASCYEILDNKEKIYRKMK